MLPLPNTFFTRPLSSLFKWMVSTRNKAFAAGRIAVTTPKNPVISIGGVHAGGTGKTPLALWCGQTLSAMGVTVAFVSRGYKRAYRQNIIIAPHEQAPWQLTGDEPALLKKNCPSAWLGIGSKRSEIVTMLDAQITSPAIYLLDDGFQHRTVGRSLDIVTLPPDPFSDKLIPLGYLREPLDNIARANICCIIGSRDQLAQSIATREKLQREYLLDKVILCITEPAGWQELFTGEREAILPLKHPAAITGIARPDRFISTLATLSIQPISWKSYSDHHAFSRDEIEELQSPECDGIITTEKDAIRIASLQLVKRPAVWYLTLQCTPHTPEDAAILASALRKAARLP